MQPIALDESLDLVGNAVVAGVEQHTGIGELGRYGLGNVVVSECDRRAVAHQRDPAADDARLVMQAAHLVLA